MSELSLEMAQLSVGRKKRVHRAFNTELMDARPTYPGDSLFQPPQHAQLPAHLPLAGGYAQQAIPSPGPQQTPAQAQGQFVPVQEAHLAQLSVQEFRHLNHHEYLAKEWVQDAQGNHYEAPKLFLTFANVAPPDLTTQFYAVDQGTALAKFMRLTMYYVPETEQLRAGTKLPLAVTIRPFAPLYDGESPVPTVDMRRLDHPLDDPLDNGPIRCRRCRAYVNPLMQFTALGHFSCNICQFPNNRVPDDYLAMLDVHNQRIDKFVRPELHRGVYDLVVPGEYNFGYKPDVKDKHGVPVAVPAPALHHVFLVDVSEQAQKQQMPLVVGDAIRAALFGGDEPRKVLIIAFDKRVHVYNLAPELDACEEAVVADLADPVVPFFHGLFGDTDALRMAIEDLLLAIEHGADQGLPDAEPCFGAALRVAMMALELVGGGKITAVLAALPSWGPGALLFKDNRAVSKALATDTEKALYCPDHEYWKQLAKEFHQKMVGLDVHVALPTSVDLSHVGWLAASTGGVVTRFPDFVYERDARAFSAKIAALVQRVRGHQGQLKLRCSNGLQVTQYYGGYVPGGENITGVNIDPVVPTISEDYTLTCLLEYDGKLLTKYDCHFQAALLYTDPQGVRKVRVINLVLAVTERLEDAFNFADENAVVATIARDTLLFVGKQPLTELRELVNQKLVEVFTQYRAMSEFGHNQNRTLLSQLLFPDSLKHLPQFLLSLIKTRAIRQLATLLVDARLQDVYAMLTMPLPRLMYHLYPALVEVHLMADDDGERDGEFVRLPKFTDLSVAHMQAGVYLMCDGDRVRVWVDPNTNPMLVQDLFGVGSVAEIDALADELPELDNDISRQVRTVIEYFNLVVGNDTGAAGIQIVRPGYDQAGELAFKERLVEDALHGAVATAAGPSYPEYLASLHKAIRDRLDNDKLSNKVRQSVHFNDHNHETLAQRMIHF